MIRVMEPCDVAEIGAMEQICFGEPWSESLISDSLSNTFDFWCVAEEGGPLCGYACLRVIAGEGEIQRIGVLPEFRRLGYGKKLMDSMVQIARKQKAKALTLEVRMGNHQAINLYKTYGFKAEAVRKEYYRNPAEDALIMWRRWV